jgi:hypothetical protein
MQQYPQPTQGVGSPLFFTVIALSIAAITLFIAILVFYAIPLALTYILSRMIVVRVH